MPFPPSQQAEIDYEIASRESEGCPPQTVSQIATRLKAIGYRLDRTFDCPGRARYVTGSRTGHSYPCVTTGIREIDSGLSYANADARRDANFRRLQDMRISGELYAITRNGILEV